MRSHLYVPGDQPERLAKAVQRGADALIVDLEDAVAPFAKAEARRIVAEFLTRQPSGGRPAIWVRVNSGDLLADDIEAVTGPALVGVVIAKCDTAETVRLVDGLLNRVEASRGLPPRSIAVAPLIESAAAVLDAIEIARGPRVVCLQIGEVDLSAELGVELGPDERELLAVRTHIVLVSAAAGIDPPVGPVSTQFTDLVTLRASTQALRRMGFRCRAAIHPAQVPVINEVFTPSSEEVERARRLVAQFDAALAAGSGLCVDEHGQMVDEAVIRGARRTFDLAAAIEDELEQTDT